MTVADPAFDLRGGGAWSVLLKLCLKGIASEASDEKMPKISVLGITNFIGPRLLGGACARCAPPWIR